MSQRWSGRLGGVTLAALGGRFAAIRKILQVNIATLARLRRVLSLAGQGQLQVVAGVHVVRPDSQCLDEVPGGLIELSLAAESHSQVVVSLGEAGLEAQGLRVFRDGFIDPALSGQRIPQFVVSLREIGIEAQGLVEMPNGLVEFSLPRQRHAQVVLSVHVVRLVPQGLAEVASGLIEFSLPHQGHSHIVLSRREIGPDAKRFGEVGDGLIGSSLLHQNSAQIVVRGILPAAGRGQAALRAAAGPGHDRGRPRGTSAPAAARGPEGTGQLVTRAQPGPGWTQDLSCSILSRNRVVAIVVLRGCPRRNASANFLAWSYSTLPGSGGSSGFTFTSTRAGPSC